MALLLPDTFSFRGFASALLILAVSAFVTSHFFPRLLGSGESERLERRILGDRFEYQDQIRSFIDDAVSTYSDAGQLVEDTVTMLRDSMRLSFVDLTILDVRTLELRHWSRIPRSDDGSPRLSSDSSLFEYFRTSLSPYLDLRNVDPAPWAGSAEKEARHQLASFDTEFVFPIKTSARPVFGILMIGPKSSESPITASDRELFLSLCRQLATTLERVDLADRAAMTEKHETLSLMSRGLAHDLNNLVTPILTFLELQEVRGPKMTADNGELHQIAKRNTETIQSYAKEAAFFAVNFKPNYLLIDLPSLLDEIKELAAERARRAGVSVEVASAVNDPFIGDRILLQRMLVNLVHNACDASPQGSVVRIRATDLSASRGRKRWLRIAVEDRGSGIPPENLKRVFDPYFSTKNTGDRRGIRGFGLGLTISQTIVHMHNGTINIRSKVGTGTSVEIGLPADPESQAQQTQMGVA